MNTTKRKYNKNWAMWKYLKYFRDYSNTPEMTPKDMFYAMDWMIDHHKIDRVGPDNSPKQLDYLWNCLMSSNINAEFLKNTFFNLVFKSIDSRNEPIDDIFNEEEDNIEVINPEEDMNSISDVLLKNDDVFYDSKDENDNFLASYKEYLFESFKRNNKKLFTF